MEAVAQRIEIHDQRDVGARRVGRPGEAGGHEEGEAGEDEDGLHDGGPLHGGEARVGGFWDGDQVFEEALAGF